jgi:hypothetical protein
MLLASAPHAVPQRCRTPAAAPLLNRPALTRRLLLSALALWVPASSPLPASSLCAPGSCVTDALFNRLRNRYILFRPGECTFEAADIARHRQIEPSTGHWSAPVH